jgi:hypothetical protein
MRFPPLVLQTDLIEPGDVLLTGKTGFESAAIAALSGGPFSHAAFFVNPWTTFESDGGIIRYKLTKHLGSAIHGEKVVSIGEMSGNPVIAELRRHPNMQAVPVERFAEAFEQELIESFGKNYSEYHRLIRLANVPGPLKDLAAETIKLYEIWTAGQSVPGPFCSELVVRIYNRLGLDCFETTRRPEQISPNALAKSKLVVEPIVITSDDLIIEKGLLPASGQALLDGLAKYRLGQRKLEKALSTFDKQIATLSPGEVQPAYHKLLSLFHETLRQAIKLADYSNQLQHPRLLKRAAHALDLALDAGPDLAELATRKEPDLDLQRLASQKLCRLATSVQRGHALLLASVTKDSLKAVRGLWAPIERGRRRSELYSLLKQVRASYTLSLKVEKETQSLLG